MNDRELLEEVTGIFEKWGHDFDNYSVWYPGAQMTPWYPPEIKPVRVGRYESKFVDGSGIIYGPVYIWWNGFFWQDRKKGAYMRAQSRHWRGLAADPTGSKP